MPRPPHTHLWHCPSISILATRHYIRRLSTALTTLHKYFTLWKLRLNTHKTETILFSKRRPPSRNLFKSRNLCALCPDSPLGLTPDSKLLFTRHLHTVANKATVVFCNIFFLFVRDSTLSRSNNLTIYKLLFRSASVCISTCSSNYLRLQVIQPKCLRVIGSHSKRILTSHLHNTLNIEPFSDFILRLTADFLLTAPHTSTL